MAPTPLALTGAYIPAHAGSIATVVIYLNGRPIAAVPSEVNPEFYSDSEIVLRTIEALFTRVFTDAGAARP
jgi:hypothetical protein